MKSSMWASATATSLLWSVPAMAQQLETVAHGVTPGLEPTWNVSFEVGAYRPRIASEGDLARDVFELQYASGFADATVDGRPLMKQLEVEYYFLHRFGRLGFNTGVGYWKVSGQSRICSDPDTGDQVACTPALVADPNTSEAGNTRTSLVIVPLRLGAVYRMDLLMDYFDVPLVPYAKAGVNYSFWWARSNGEVTTTNGESSSGGTFGIEGTVGMALSLDWLSPHRAGRSGVGMTGTYLYGEGNFLYATGFSEDRLDLSDITVFIGLGIDFS